MSAPHPASGGATDAEIAAAVAALLVVGPPGDTADAASPDASRPGAVWRRAAGPLPGGWPARGWRGPARPRPWS